MRVLSCPRAYERYVTSALAVLLAEIGRDISWRSDEDARIRSFAPVPAEFIDPEADGRVVILIGVPDGLSDTAAVTELLVAARPTLRSA